MNNLYRLLLVLPVLAVAFARQADADVVIALDDTGFGGIEVIIADGQAAGFLTAFGATTHADADGFADGVVTAPGSLVAGNFSIDTAIGFGFGGGPDATVDLLLSVTALAPGTLEAWVTATNLTTDDGVSSITGSIGGFSSPGVGGTAITYTGAIDPGNGQFVFPGGSTVGPVSIGGGTFGTSVNSHPQVSNPFSLSEKITITADSSGQIIAFDAQLTGEVPEPSSLALWAVASGMSVWVARRKKARETRQIVKG